MGTITQRLGRASRVVVTAAVTVGLPAGLAAAPAPAVPQPIADRWASARDAVRVLPADGLPLRTPSSALAVRRTPDDAALDREVVALRARASRTAGLVAAAGEERVRLCWSEEAFVSADPVATHVRTRGTRRVAA